MKRERAIQLLVMGGMFSVFLLPPEESFFPLSRYGMFATERPTLEPLPFVELELDSGQKHKIASGVWNRGGISSARNQLQLQLRRSDQEQQQFCRYLAHQISSWLEKKAEKGVMLRVKGGQFDRKDVVHAQEIVPVHAKTIVECPLNKHQENGERE